MQDKILLVFTGGIIGSVMENNVVNVSEDKNYLVLNMYKKLPDRKDIKFDTISPVNILSENVMIEDWNKIVDSINQQNLSEYKGIIITHGTDTLGYFANALAYMLHKVEIPIIIVSSNLVLTNPNANGMDNFKTAVDFITDIGGKGVFVVYRNTDRIVYIHKGTRVQQIVPLTEDVHSVKNQYFAKVVDGNIIKNTEDDNMIRTLYDLDFKPKFEDILYIKLIVGQNYDFDIDKYKIIYFEMFHSGTIPKQALPLIKECQEKNKLFFMGCAQKMTYAPTEEAIRNGAIMLFNMSQEATIIKLMMANGTFNTNKEIKEFMSKNILGEILD